MTELGHGRGAPPIDFRQMEARIERLEAMLERTREDVMTSMRLITLLVQAIDGMMEARRRMDEDDGDD